MCKIFLNGALIDKKYLTENIEESLNIDWQQCIVQKTTDHIHCNICNIAITYGNESFKS